MPKWLSMEGIAALLGVSQVTLFRSGSVPNNNYELMHNYQRSSLHVIFLISYKLTLNYKTS